MGAPWRVMVATMLLSAAVALLSGGSGSTQKRRETESLRGELSRLMVVPVSASPDGRRALVKVYTAQGFELRLLDTHTGKATVLDQSRNTQLALAWRPDGDALAFLECEGGNRRFRPWLIDTTSGHRRALAAPETHSAALPIRWSPSGERLAYVATAGASTLVVAQPDLDRYRVIATDLLSTAEIAWSPDGTLLAAVLRHEPGAVVTMDATSGAITDRLAVSHGEIRQLAFSSNGRALLATARDTGQSYFHLYEVDRATHAIRTIAALNGDVSDPLVTGPGRIVFRLNRDGELTLYSTSPDGADPHPLEPVDGVSVVRSLSRDGRTAYAVHTGRQTPPELIAIPLDGRPRSMLVAAPSPRLPPSSAALHITDPSTPGLTIPAYLWQSAGRTRRALLILVHGASVQTPRAWDPTIQIAVEQGFDVLAVNYRGSTGYGAEWERASNDEGAADVQATIAFAIDTLLIPPRKVFLLGTSHGSALVSKALQQPRWRIGGAIVLSMPKEPSARRAPPWAFPPVVGFHGVNDEIASPSEAQRILEAMFDSAAPDAKRGTWRVFDDEGHHFHRLESWVEIHAALGQLLHEAG